MMIVPALVTSGDNGPRQGHSHRAGRIVRIEVLGAPPGQEQAKIRAGAEQNRDQESSTKGESSHPASIIQARTPREITRLTPIVTRGTSASQNER